MQNKPFKAVVIGASAGALEALSGLLPALPAGYGLPVLVVVHMPPDRNSMLTELLQRKCNLDVREAQDKETILPGVVYIAPPDYHLMVEKNARLSLSSEEPVMYSRPSIDVLFETATDAYAEGLIGIVLSGANSDGARGLRLIGGNGGITLVQDPDTAHASAMPEAAIVATPNAQVLTLAQIASFLQKAHVP